MLCFMRPQLFEAGLRAFRKCRVLLIYPEEYNSSKTVVVMNEGFIRDKSKNNNGNNDTST